MKGIFTQNIIKNIGFFDMNPVDIVEVAGSSPVSSTKRGFRGNLGNPVFVGTDSETPLELPCPLPETHHESRDETQGRLETEYSVDE